MELQMCDLWGDSLRDLALHRRQGPSGGLSLQREAEADIEELPNGDLQLMNVQSFKVNNIKETTKFIDGCLEYQRKLEAERKTPLCLVHTLANLKFTYAG